MCYRRVGVLIAGCVSCKKQQKANLKYGYSYGGRIPDYDPSRGDVSPQVSTFPPAAVLRRRRCVLNFSLP